MVEEGQAQSWELWNSLLKISCWGDSNQDGGLQGHRVHLFSQIHQKMHLYLGQFSQNTYWTLAEDLRILEGQEWSPHNWVGGNKKKKKKSGKGPAPLGENYKRGNIPAPWEGSSPVGRSTWIEGELQGLNKRREQQTVKNNMHRRLTPPHCDPNLRYSSVSGGGGWVLKCRLQSSGPGKGPEISMETTWRGQL